MLNAMVALKLPDEYRRLRVHIEQHFVAGSR